MFGKLSRSWKVAIGVLAMLLAVAIAHAAIPDSNGVIHACYGNNGSLRVVDGPATCHPNETPLGAVRTFSSPPNTIRARCDSDRHGHAYGEITAIKVNGLGVKP